MKYILSSLAGIAASLFVIIFLSGIESFFNITISEFSTGWFSCLGFITGMKIYQIIKEIEPVQ